MRCPRSPAIFKQHGEFSGLAAVAARTKQIPLGTGIADKQADSQAMFDDGIELICKCWTDHRGNFKGKHYQVDNLEVRPKPFQQRHPPIHMAACPR